MCLQNGEKTEQKLKRFSSPVTDFNRLKNLRHFYFSQIHMRVIRLYRKSDPWNLENMICHHPQKMIHMVEKLILCNKNLWTGEKYKKKLNIATERAIMDILKMVLRIIPWFETSERSKKTPPQKGETSNNEELPPFLWKLIFLC